MDNCNYQKDQSFIMHASDQVQRGCETSKTSIEKMINDGNGKEGILKLLDVEIIFAISNGQWVIPVQVVLRKVEVIVEANQEGEIVPI